MPTSVLPTTSLASGYSAFSFRTPAKVNGLHYPQKGKHGQKLQNDLSIMHHGLVLKACATLGSYVNPAGDT